MRSFSGMTLRLLPAALSLAAIALLQSCGGSGAVLEQGPDTALAGPQLAWPPSGLPTRLASDDTIFVDGVDCLSKGGSTQNQQTILLLRPGNGLSYAIYGVGGFGPNVSLANLTVDFNQVSGTVGDGTALYVGLSDFSAQRWQWTLADVPAESFDFGAEFADYVSPSGTFYVACVRIGPGNVAINHLSFARTGSGAFVPAPQNLLLAPQFGSIDLSWDAVEFVQGYDIYRDDDAAFDNPMRLNGVPVTTAAYNDTSVVPETPYWYAVKALRGQDPVYQESSFSEVETVTSLPATVPAPANLTGFGDVGVAHLSWDAVTGATSYVLYRSTSYSFANPVQIQAVITDPFYDDVLAPNPSDKSYFYKVIAKAGPQLSDYSNQADVFVPGADLPAPTNLRIEAQQGDFVTVAWDYVDMGQLGFKVYFSYFPDFDMAGPFYHVKPDLADVARSYSLFGLPSGQTFYVRVCAFNNSGRGRVTDDISFNSESYWSWEVPTNLGSGSGPLVLLDGDGASEKETLAFFQGSGVLVKQLSAGVWSGAESVGLDSGFGVYMDMASSGSDYIIGASETATDDAWVSIGVPGGSWSAERIHGDGDDQLGHGESAYCLKVAADANEYSVTHIFYADTAPPGRYDLMLQQHPNGAGSWDLSTIKSDVAQIIHSSMQYSGGNLTVLFQDPVSHELLLGDQTGGFSWDDIGGSTTQNVGLYNDLKPYNGEWLTPAYNGATAELNVLQGSGASWNSTLLTGGLNNLNRMQIAILDDGDPSPPAAMLVFYSSANSRWFYAYFDGTDWSVSSIIIPGITFGVNMDICRTVFGGGQAYPMIVFDDSMGTLWSSWGTPPS